MAVCGGIPVNEHTKYVNSELMKNSGNFWLISFCFMIKDDFEVVYVTIGNPAFYLLLYLTGIHFRDELQHVGNVSEQKS